MPVGIDDLFDMLSWNSDEDTQRKGIELAKNVKCYSVFLQPNGLQHSKDVWENCAKILCDIPDENLQYYSLGMLEWLEDINWPGAEMILNRLIAFTDTSWLAVSISTSVKRALACDRQGWLGNMSALLENENLRVALPKDIRNVLSSRYQQHKNLSEPLKGKWLKKCLELYKNPEAIIQCPLCELENLEVKDVLIEEELIERRVYCPNCKMKDYATMLKDFRM